MVVFLHYVRYTYQSNPSSWFPYTNCFPHNTDTRVVPDLCNRNFLFCISLTPVCVPMHTLCSSFCVLKDAQHGPGVYFSCSWNSSQYWPYMYTCQQVCIVDRRCFVYWIGRVWQSDGMVHLVHVAELLVGVNCLLLVQYSIWLDHQNFVYHCFTPCPPDHQVSQMWWSFCYSCYSCGQQTTVNFYPCNEIFCTRCQTSDVIHAKSG